MYYHVKSRSQMELKTSKYEWELLANTIDVIHDVIMNNRYNGSQKTRQQQQQQQYQPKSCVFALRLITARTSVSVNSAIRVKNMDI